VGNPEQQLLDKLLREDIVRALQALPEAYRVAVILVEVRGFSYVEAAEALGVPVGTIRSRLTVTADPALNRNESDGRGMLLTITLAGLDAIGIEPTVPEAPVEYRFNEGTNSAGEPAGGAPTSTEEQPVEPAPKKRGRRKKTAPTGADTAAPRKSRDATNQVLMITMLPRPEGGSIDEIIAATAWQAHYADVRIMPR
jgi:hypothetical protein